MSDVKERLADLIEQQCAAIGDMDLVLSAQHEAVGRDAFDEVQALDRELTVFYTRFDAMQKEIEAAELELVTAYQGLTKEQLAVEIPHILELRATRLKRLTEHFERQQTFRNSLLKLLAELTEDGRQLSQTMHAFNEYRNAARLNPRVLDLKK